MTVHLLDANVLIALIDGRHVANPLVTEWFSDNARTGWASCPLTQNAVLRIVGGPGYRNTPGSPAAVGRNLADLLTHAGHEFWPDDISLLDETIFVPDRLTSSGQLTDTYLLGLAVRRNGRLATLDRRLVANAVRNGARHLHVIQ